MALRAKRNPFKPDQVVKAVQTFGYQDGVVHRNEEYRGGDPVVEAHWTRFVDAGTLDHEMPSFWNDQVPALVEHPSRLIDTGLKISAWRQVKSMVDVQRPAAWAPDSPGEKSGRPAPFFHASLVRGQIVDLLDPRVKANPSWFELPRRDVSLEDVERAVRLAEIENLGDDAA